MVFLFSSVGAVHVDVVVAHAAASSRGGISGIIALCVILPATVLFLALLLVLLSLMVRIITASVRCCVFAVCSWCSFCC